jgi:hypothetical protein
LQPDSFPHHRIEFNMPVGRFVQFIVGVAAVPGSIGTGVNSSSSGGLCGSKDLGITCYSKNECSSCCCGLDASCVANGGTHDHCTLCCQPPGDDFSVNNPGDDSTVNSPGDDLTVRGQSCCGAAPGTKCCNANLGELCPGPTGDVACPDCGFTDCLCPYQLTADTQPGSIGMSVNSSSSRGCGPRELGMTCQSKDDCNSCCCGEDGELEGDGDRNDLCTICPGDKLV